MVFRVVCQKLLQIRIIQLQADDGLLLFSFDLEKGVVIREKGGRVRRFNIMVHTTVGAFLHGLVHIEGGRFLHDDALLPGSAPDGQILVDQVELVFQQIAPCVIVVVHLLPHKGELILRQRVFLVDDPGKLRVIVGLDAEIRQQHEILIKIFILHLQEFGGELHLVQNGLIPDRSLVIIQ